MIFNMKYISYIIIIILILSDKKQTSKQTNEKTCDLKFGSLSIYEYQDNM